MSLAVEESVPSPPCINSSICKLNSAQGESTNLQKDKYKNVAGLAFHWYQTVKFLHNELL